MRLLAGVWGIAFILGVGFSQGMALAEGTAALSWDANSEPDLAGYNLYYGTSSGIYDTTINVGNTTTYTVSDLTEGLTYFFSVTAYDLVGNESLPSEEVSAVLSCDPDSESTIIIRRWWGDITFSSC